MVPSQAENSQTRKRQKGCGDLAQMKLLEEAIYIALEFPFGLAG
jgi:hypothetical protein